MRVLIIQENGRHDRNRNFRECFCLAQYDTEPAWDEYGLIINLENYDEQNWVPNLQKFSAKKFLWSIDAHVKGLACYEKTAVEGRYDLILQATPEFVTSRHAPSVWLPNCYDDEVIKPTNSLPLYDWGFCGNINNRMPIINAMGHVSENGSVDVMAIGPDMVSAICSYKLHINANISIDINYRNFETMGCRVPLITNYNQHG